MDESPASVESLVLAFQQGDESAMDRLVERMRGPLLRIATWVVRDPVTAEDIFIDSMAKLLTLLSDFDTPSKFDAYAKRTVRNAAVDTIRRRSDRDSIRSLRDTDRIARARRKEPGTFVEGMPGNRPNPEQSLIMNERRDNVRAAVSGLREPRKTIVELFYDEECTYDEIAEKLGLSPATVKRHLAAARQVLAGRLRGMEGDRLVS